MALINCPECKRKVSNQANICPHCNYRLGTTVGRFLKRLLRPIFYKTIPNDIAQIGNLNLLLSFKDRKYTYYSPRFLHICDDKDIKAEITTLNGDLIAIRFAMLSDEFKQEFKNKKTKEEKLFWVVDTVKDKEPGKNINKEVFNNGCWEGAILESVTNDNQRIAIVVFTFHMNMISLTLVVPPEAPENLYYENIQLLKSAHLSECLKEKYKIYEERLAE